MNIQDRSITPPDVVDYGESQCSFCFGTGKIIDENQTADNFDEKKLVECFCSGTGKLPISKEEFNNEQENFCEESQKDLDTFHQDNDLNMYYDE